MKVPFCDVIQNVPQAPSKCLKQWKKWINWIISKTHQRILKILFVLGADEYLEGLEGKIRKYLFFYVEIFQNNSVTNFAQFSRVSSF